MKTTSYQMIIFLLTVLVVHPAFGVTPINMNIANWETVATLDQPFTLPSFNSSCELRVIYHSEEDTFVQDRIFPESSKNLSTSQQSGGTSTGRTVYFEVNATDLYRLSYTNGTLPYSTSESLSVFLNNVFYAAGVRPLQHSLSLSNSSGPNGYFNASAMLYVRYIPANMGFQGTLYQLFSLVGSRYTLQKKCN